MVPTLAPPAPRLLLKGTGRPDPARGGETVFRGPVLVLLQLPAGASVRGTSLSRRLLDLRLDAPPTGLQALAELPQEAARELGADRAWTVAFSGEDTYELSLTVLMDRPGAKEPLVAEVRWLQGSAPRRASG